MKSLLPFTKHIFFTYQKQHRIELLFLLNGRRSQRDNTFINIHGMQICHIVVVGEAAQQKKMEEINSQEMSFSTSYTPREIAFNHMSEHISNFS
jgi:hypothetical protein